MNINKFFEELNKIAVDMEINVDKYDISNLKMIRDIVKGFKKAMTRKEKERYFDNFQYLFNCIDVFEMKLAEAIVKKESRIATLEVNLKDLQESDKIDKLFDDFKKVKN